MAGWLRGGLCDAWAGRRGDLKAASSVYLNGKLSCISRFQLAYIALLRPLAKSPLIFLYLAQNLLFRCNSVREENVSSFEKWNTSSLTELLAGFTELTYIQSVVSLNKA